MEICFTCHLPSSQIPQNSHNKNYCNKDLQPTTVKQSPEWREKWKNNNLCQEGRVLLASHNRPPIQYELMGISSSARSLASLVSAYYLHFYSMNLFHGVRCCCVSRTHSKWSVSLGCLKNWQKNYGICNHILAGEGQNLLDKWWKCSTFFFVVLFSIVFTFSFFPLLVLCLAFFRKLDVFPFKTHIMLGGLKIWYTLTARIILPTEQLYNS